MRQIVSLGIKHSPKRVLHPLLDARATRSVRGVNAGTAGTLGVARAAHGAMMNAVRTETTPQWLCAWRPRRPVKVADLLSSRVVFCPGSGTDGQPVKFFGSRHLAHGFVLVDYVVSRERIEHELGESGRPFAGYKGVDRIRADRGRLR